MSCDLFSTTCAASGPSTYCDIVSPPSEVLPLRLRTGLKVPDERPKARAFFLASAWGRERMDGMEGQRTWTLLVFKRRLENKDGPGRFVRRSVSKRDKRRVYVESALISSSAKSR